MKLCSAIRGVEVGVGVWVGVGDHSCLDVRYTVKLTNLYI